MPLPHIRRQELAPLLEHERAPRLEREREQRAFRRGAEAAVLMPVPLSSTVTTNWGPS